MHWILQENLFKETDSFNEAVMFHEERAAKDPEIKVIVYTTSEWQRKMRREQNLTGR